MFGELCAPPPNASIFFWVWIYKYKEVEQHYKACGVCDGSTRGGKARILGHTYAATPDMTDFRLFVALCAYRGDHLPGRLRVAHDHQ